MQVNNKRDRILSEKINMLKRFSLQAEKLEQYPEFFKDIKMSFNFTRKKSKAQITSNAIDDKILAPVINAFRPFYLKRGRNNLNFKRIAESLLSEPEFSEYHNKIQEYHDVWVKLTETDWNSGMVINVEGNEWSTKTVFNKWINEGYVHQEQYKKGSGRGTDALRRHPMMELSSRVVFVDLLQRLTQLMISFNKQIVKKILDSEDSSMI